MQEFELIYYMRGMNYTDVENMTGSDRDKLHYMLGEYLKEHPPGLFG